MVNTTQTRIDIEGYVNGVVHPITNDTITKYKTLIEDQIVKNKWKKAMCVELDSWHKDTKTSLVPT